MSGTKYLFSYKYPRQLSAQQKGVLIALLQQSQGQDNGKVRIEGLAKTIIGSLIRRGLLTGNPDGTVSLTPAGQQRAIELSNGPGKPGPRPRSGSSTR